MFLVARIAGTVTKENAAALALGVVGNSARSNYEVVIRRALELAESTAATTAWPDSTTLGNLPPDAMAEIAGELGIPGTALAQALAEQKAGANRPRTISDRLLGEASVSASHRCGFDESNAQQRMHGWLERGHGLRTRTAADGVVVGHRRRGAVGRMSNAVRKARGEGGLSSSREVRAAVVSLGENTTGLSVVADLSDQRTKSVVAGAFTTAGAASLSGVVLIFTPFAALGLPVAAAAGFLVARLSHRSTVRRFATEVELTVDAVAAGAEPSTAASAVADRLRSRRKLP